MNRLTANKNKFSGQNKYSKTQHVKFTRKVAMVTSPKPTEKNNMSQPFVPTHQGASNFVPTANTNGNVVSQPGSTAPIPVWRTHQSSQNFDFDSNDNHCVNQDIINDSAAQNAWLRIFKTSPSAFQALLIDRIPRHVTHGAVLRTILRFECKKRQELIKFIKPNTLKKMIEDLSKLPQHLFFIFCVRILKKK